MNLEELSIVAIKSLLAKTGVVPNELVESLITDSRSGVRDIGEEILRKRAEEETGRKLLEEMLELERSYHARGILRVAGVDEAGRGPLAGPVVAAAVIFPHDCDHPQARDSKTLTRQKREELYGQIYQKALTVGIGRVDNNEIDRLNIYNASIVAMNRAVEALDPEPQAIVVDGPMVLRFRIPQQAVVGGDARCLSVAAASVVAKVFRDRLMMEEYDRAYPGYGFARHKGYPTADHFKALKELGPCPLHRRSFKPVADCGDFPNPEWSFFFDGLSSASCLEELELIAADIKKVRHVFTRHELSSLRLAYSKRRGALSAEALIDKSGDSY